VLLSAKVCDDASVIVGVSPNDNGEINMSDNPLAYTVAEALVCGSAIKPRRASRQQKYCSHRCRDEAHRARNFAASGLSPAIPRSVQKDGVKSTACKPGFTERIPIELIGHSYRWCGAVRAFRRSEADMPTRPEAIRRLLQQAIAVSLRQVKTQGSDR
jgi:hypothetical protein